VNLPPVGAPTDSRATVDHVAHHRALARNVGDADDGWHDLLLEFPWVPYSGYEPVAYRRVGLMVVLRGLVWPTRAVEQREQTISVLPEGYRPSTGIEIQTGTGNYSSGNRYHSNRVDVYQDGRIVPNFYNYYGDMSGVQTNWCSLSGIWFVSEVPG
jgi:hypothetical protein